MENSKAPTEISDKEVYQPPKLIEFGSIEEITLGGAGAPFDSQGSAT